MLNYDIKIKAPFIHYFYVRIQNRNRNTWLKGFLHVRAASIAKSNHINYQMGNALGILIHFKLKIWFENINIALIYFECKRYISTTK